MRFKFQKKSAAQQGHFKEISDEIHKQVQSEQITLLESSSVTSRCCLLCEESSAGLNRKRNDSKLRLYCSAGDTRS